VEPVASGYLEYLASTPAPWRLAAQLITAVPQLVRDLEEQLEVYGIDHETLASEDVEELVEVFASDETVRWKLFEAAALGAQRFAAAHGGNASASRPEGTAPGERPF